MYNASLQFHTAVCQNAPDIKVLFRFENNTVLTNEDIHINSGINIMEAVNYDEELTIGSCTSSNLEVTVMNYHGLLSDYAFRDCKVYLGVKTGMSKQSSVNANTVVNMQFDESLSIQFCGHTKRPYLTVDGIASPLQPPHPVYALIASDTTLYCVGMHGEIWGMVWDGRRTWYDVGEYTWDNLGEYTWMVVSGDFYQADIPLLSQFMLNKLIRLAQDKRGLSINGTSLIEYFIDGNTISYEYVPLGVFMVDTPKKRNADLIKITASDRMSKFDVIIDDFLNSYQYPSTMGAIFEGLCDYVNVPCRRDSFINKNRVFFESPVHVKNITGREVLKWIAEAAGSYARITRDGEVELVWFNEANALIESNCLFSVEVAEYEVSAIDKLEISNSNSVGVVIGTGSNGYQILDNPFLMGNDSEIRVYGAPLYRRLSSFNPFAPILARAVCDWSYQAGDVIRLVYEGTTYRLPIYSQTIHWQGGAAKVVYECTGAEKRPVMSAANRTVFEQNKSKHEMIVSIDRLVSAIYDENGDSKIEQNAQSISLVVSSEGINVASIVTAINSSESSILISADHINLDGYVTIENLRDGETTISGANIKTGLINADHIDVDNLYVKHLDAADGKFTNLIGTDYIELGKARLTVDGLYLSGKTDETRILMNPPTMTVSAGDDARWIYRSDYGYYSLGIASSSINFKKNITDLNGVECCEIIDRLHPVLFNYIEDNNDTLRTPGFIAEETAKVYPEITVFNKNKEPLSVKYKHIVALLVADAQHTHEVINELRARIDDLRRERRIK